MKRKTKSKIKSELEELDNDRVEFLPTGSINLNLAASGKAKKGGIGRGRIINVVGDKSAGKTAICLEICAQTFYFIKELESKIWQTPKKVSIVYNNREGVMDFPLNKMFGDRFVDGVEWIHSEYMEECGRDILRRVTKLKKGEFLLYVADSVDAFESKKQMERVEKSVKTDKEVEKTMGMEKPKYLSTNFFPRLSSLMKQKDKDATIILVSQVRDNIDAGMFADKYRRNGGKALDFYSHQVCWLAVVKKLTKEVNKKKIPFGVTTKAQFRKNKIATPFRNADIDILFANKYTPAGIGGIDDIGSMIKFMGYKKDSIPEWTKKINKLIKQVKNKWVEMEKAIVQKRERRYPE